MSRAIVCGCGVGSYCEGRVEVTNTLGDRVRGWNGCVVSAVARGRVSGSTVVGAGMLETLCR